MELRNALLEFCKNAEKILLTTHKKPDEDAVASVLILSNFLKLYMVPHLVAIEGEDKDKWKYLYGYQNIRFVESLKPFEDNTWIAVDANSISRLSGADLQVSTAFFIDHHAPEKKGSNAFIKSTYSSTSEILFRELFDNKTTDAKLAQLVAVGIIGDTGGLRFIPKESNALSIIEGFIKLYNLNVDSLRYLNESLPKEALPLIKTILENSEIKNVVGWPKFFLAKLPQQKNISNSIKSAAVGHVTMTYLRAFEGVDWGIIISEDDEGVSLSFRAKPDAINVRLIVQEMGIGGGHDLAAGGYIRGVNLNEAEEKIYKWLSENRRK